MLLRNVLLSVIGELYGWRIEASIWMSESNFDNYVVDEWCKNLISIPLEFLCKFRIQILVLFSYVVFPLTV